MDFLVLFRSYLRCASQSFEHTLLASKGFWQERNYREMQVIEQRFHKMQQRLVHILQPYLGEPSFTGDCNSQNFPDWAAIEATILAVWIGSTITPYVGVLKHDKETPYLLVWGAHMPNTNTM
jgi:hypothetical protein